jgi:hypothetical protein
MMKRLRSFLIGAALGGPFYLLLIDTTTAPELIAGAIAVLIAAAVYEISYSQGLGDAAFKLSAIRDLARACAGIPKQMLVVSAEILAQTVSPRQQRGKVRALPLDRADDESALGLGERVLTEALGSLAPNSFVIGVDPDGEQILVHELRAP